MSNYLRKISVLMFQGVEQSEFDRLLRESCHKVRTLSSPHILLLLANIFLALEVILADIFFFQEEQNGFDYVDALILITLLLSLSQTLMTHFSLRSKAKAPLIKILTRCSKLLNIWALANLFVAHTECLERLLDHPQNNKEVVILGQTFAFAFIVCSYLNSQDFISFKAWISTLLLKVLIWLIYEVKTHFSEANAKGGFVLFVISAVFSGVMFALIVNYSWARSKQAIRSEAMFKELLSNLDMGVVCLNNKNEVIFKNQTIDSILKEGKGLGPHEYTSYFLSHKVNEIFEKDTENVIRRNKGIFVQSPKKTLSSNTASCVTIAEALMSRDIEYVSEKTFSVMVDEEQAQLMVNSDMCSAGISRLSGRNQTQTSGQRSWRGNKRRFYEIHISLLKSKFDKPESTKCFKLVVFRDITSAQRVLKYHEEKSVKNKLLQGFSHELHTPLNGALSVLDCGLEDKALPLEHRKKYLLQPRTSLFFLKLLIGDIVDYLKIETSQLLLETDEFNLRDLLHEVYDLIFPKVNFKGLIFNLDGNVFTRPKLSILSDRGRLRRLVFNLLNNCVKNTFSGMVTLKVNINQNQSELNFEIGDTRFEGNEHDLQPLDQEFSVFVSLHLAKLLEPTKGLNQEVDLDHGVRFSFSLLLIKEQAENKLNLPLSEAVIEPLEIKKQPTPSSNKSDKSPRKLFSVISGFCDAGSFSPSRIEFSETSNNHYIIPSFDSHPSKEKPPPLEKKKKPILRAMSSFRVDIEEEEVEINEKGKKSSKKISSLKDIEPNDSTTEVLIVDDDAFNIMSLEMILKKKQIKSYKAFNGRQAIDLVKDYYQRREEELPLDVGITIIFMDLNMPVMNGIECTKELVLLMEQGILPKIPIIGCSANDSQLDIKNCKDVGMSGFLAKPVTINKVNELLQIYLDNQTRQTQCS